MIWEEDLRDRVPFSFQHIKGAVPVAFTLDVDLDHLTEVAFVSFLHCKLTLSFLFPSPSLVATRLLSVAIGLPIVDISVRVIQHTAFCV